MANNKKKKEYEYPVDYVTYSIPEVTVMIDFLAYLEDNENNDMDPVTFKKRYNIYRNTVNSIQEEKRINKEFEELSGISIFKIAKKMGL